MHISVRLYPVMISDQSSFQSPIWWRISLWIWFHIRKVCFVVGLCLFIRVLDQKVSFYKPALWQSLMLKLLYTWNTIKLNRILCMCCIICIICIICIYMHKTKNKLIWLNVTWHYVTNKVTVTNLHSHLICGSVISTVKSNAIIPLPFYLLLEH